MITAQQLTQICPALKGKLAINVAGHLGNICPKYGINTADIFHEFIANLLTECGEFTRFTENLNYSPKRLMQVWPKRFPDLRTAEQFAYKGEKLANYVYGGRKDLGNVKLGDGWLFRGSGPIQITGRDNTTAFTNYYNKLTGSNYTPEQMAELLRTDIAIGIHSACWFFAIAKKLILAAINDQFKIIVQRINGGYNGLDDRTRYYERAKSVVR